MTDPDSNQEPQNQDKNVLTDPAELVEAAKKEFAVRQLARSKMLVFVERFTPNYDAGWIHKDICERLEQFSQDIVEQKSPRLMLFMPPRHGKSTLASIAFPAWHLGRHPSHEFISCSYSGSLAMSFSRKVRQLLREPTYQSMFETRLDPQSQSAEAWLTTDAGGYVAAGVGGGITGKGAHCLVIDDPVRNREDAESEVGREATYNWFTSTAYTRLAPGAGVLVILTRWHDDDLAGRLLTEMDKGGEQWEIVSYPAIATEDEQFRLEGQALHPARYDVEALARIRRAIGPRDWSALYQQNPVADDGDYFKRDMIRYFTPDDVDLNKLEKYTAWDLAIGQKEQNDYSVGLTVGIDHRDRIFVIDVVRGRFNGLELVENILTSFEDHDPSVVGIEKGHIDMAVGPFLEKRIQERGLSSIYIEELKTGKRDKLARARAIQGRMQQGMVRFPKEAAFTESLVNELLRFPNGKHDDQVDALAWIGLMMNDISGSRPERHVPPPSWRDGLSKTYHGPGLPRRRSAMTA